MLYSGLLTLNSTTYTERDMLTYDLDHSPDL